MSLMPGTRRSARHGYALLTTLVFLVLMLAMMGVAQRHLASTLRVEQARAQAELRDEGRIHALAKALELLETGRPPSDPYVCTTTIDTSQGPESLTVTYTKETEAIWVVHVGPTTFGNPPSMPASFAD